MSYKTRKTNKKKYLRRKSLSKKYRNMYGGNQNDALITEEKKEVPTLMTNLGDAGKLATSVATNLVSDGIQTAAETFGIDPNKSVQENVSDMKNGLDNVIGVLKTEEGQKLVEDIGKLGEETVEALKPAINEAVNETNELIKKEIPLVGDMANKAVLEIPVVGQVAAIAEEGMDLVQSLENATESVAKLTTTGSESLGKLQEQKRKAESLWEQGKQLFSGVTDFANTKVSNILADAQNNVNNYGKDLIKSKMPKVEIPKVEMPTYNSKINVTGDTEGTLKKMHKEGLMVGGRVHKSQLEFLSPQINSNKIIRQFGGKLSVKRRGKLSYRQTKSKR